MERLTKNLARILFILDTIPFLVIIIGLVYVVSAALKDSEGGGWLLFIVILSAPIILVPLGVQEAFSIATMIFAKKQKYKSAMIGSIGVAITNATIIIIVLAYYFDIYYELHEMKYHMVVLAICGYFGLSCILATIITVKSIVCGKQYKQ